MRPQRGAPMEPDESRYPPISDYALIGDSRCAALVSRTGAIEWFCLPRFDSPSLFGALLDRARGGHFTLRPVGPFNVERHYRRDSNVLETRFTTPSGTACLTDALVFYSPERRSRSLAAPRHLMRRVAVEQGAVEMEAIYRPKHGYGLVPMRLERRGDAIACEVMRGIVLLRSRPPLSLDADGGVASIRWRARAGEVNHFSLVYDENGPAVLPVLGAEADLLLEETDGWWKGWAARCRYEGEWREAVVRSALALKLLAFAPSGAVIAAPTTSLPEYPGGVRNWDYRYCWLRDAALTMRAFLRLGYLDEARAFLGWLLHSTHLTWPRLRVLYDVHGEAPDPEQVLEELEGYGGARPVRVGNGAVDQLQLDVYGEVAEAVYEYFEQAGAPAGVDFRLLVGLGREVCRLWQLPDEGIWEGRAERTHHTYSKVMCWVALDRLLRLHRRGVLKAPTTLFESAAKSLRERVEREGYDEGLQSYVAAFGSRELDASLLRLASYGYLPASHPRMAATHRAIRSHLGLPRGLMRRYLGSPDGLPPGEGAFLACSFWEAQYLAMRGDQEMAAALLRQLAAHANDVGLFSEEVDPRSGALWGNFPQSFSHVGLIVAALALEQGEAR